jgi:hypothetical protein
MVLRPSARHLSGATIASRSESAAVEIWDHCADTDRWTREELPEWSYVSFATS